MSAELTVYDAGTFATSVAQSVAFMCAVVESAKISDASVGAAGIT